MVRTTAPVPRSACQAMASLEGAGHRREPAAVGEAVGGGGDERAGEDAEEPEAGPEADDAEGAGPAGQRVDHAAEEDRLGELDDGEQDAGHGERDRERPLGGEQRDGAAVDGERGHRREDRAARARRPAPDQAPGWIGSGSGGVSSPAGSGVWKRGLRRSRDRGGRSAPNSPARPVSASICRVMQTPTSR